MFGVGGVERWGVVRVGGILRHCAVNGFLPGMGGMFGSSRRGMLEALESTFDVTRNRYVNSPVGVIPIEGQAAILSAGPIFADSIQLFQCSYQMFGIGSVGVFDTKIIDDKCEHQITGVMLPQSGGNGNRGITMWGEECSEAVTGNSAGLR